MDDDTLSRENSFDTISTYDGDLLVSPEISAPEKPNDKNVVDLIKCICCFKR
jgi:hypothetical protein